MKKARYVHYELRQGNEDRYCLCDNWKRHSQSFIRSAYESGYGAGVFCYFKYCPYCGKGLDSHEIIKYDG